MGVIEKLVGPRSKYDPELPYTYEARVRVIEGEEEYTSYVADTVCALVAYLDAHGIGPQAARLFEIYREREGEIDTALVADAAGNWFSKAEICRSFEAHYPGHIHASDCSFSDRDQRGRG